MVVAFMLMVTLCMTSSVYAEDVKPLKAAIYVDQKPIKTDYILKEGHLYVPALFFKQTGAYVDWNEKYQSVVFQLQNKMVAFPVGKNYYDLFNKETNTWTSHPLKLTAVKVNKKPFMPLVTVAKQLGMDVTYDAATKRTYVATNNYVEPNLFMHGDRTQKLVALTFDDGPDPYYTPTILDILKDKNAPATFFMMGKNIAKYPEQVKRMVKEGHAIGNHSYNHPDFTKQWTAKVVDEIQSTQHELLKVVGKKPDIIRPPYGALTKADTRLLNQLGLRNIFWSVDTLDWKGKTSDEIMEIVRRQIFPGGIILQHNFEAKKGELNGSIEALPKIIDELREQGYTFVTIQTLLDSQKRR